jgi:phosphatidate cytidylyltransferase
MIGILNERALVVFGVILGVLAIVTVGAELVSIRDQEKRFTELRDRTRSWWVILLPILGSMALGRTATAVFFGFVSFLAFKEFVTLIPSRRADRRALFWAYLSIPFQYGLVITEWYVMFLIFIPVYLLLILPMRLIIAGVTDGFIRSVSAIHWGLMLTVFSLSHLAYMLYLPSHGAVTGATMVLFTLLLTELNDVAQFVWGKSFGRHKVIPLVSPGKTWEGLLGGIGTTLVLGALLGPYLTPLSLPLSVGVSLLIGVAGFFGDLCMSAVKRDLKLKDTGSLLPGHGGILDRVDSLTFTAPLVFHFIAYFIY